MRVREIGITLASNFARDVDDPPRAAIGTVLCPMGTPERAGGCVKNGTGPTPPAEVAPADEGFATVGGPRWRGPDLDISCPLCGTALTWKRRLLGANLWAQWKCSGCGSTLGWRGLYRVPFAVAVFAVAVFGGMLLPAGVPRPEGQYVLLAMIWIVWTLFGERVRLIRIAPNRCRQCGYDLSANLSGVCPECGHPRAEAPPCSPAGAEPDPRRMTP
jgi:hypothetical protein